MSQVHRAVERGLAYIRSVQGEDGGFITQISLVRRPFLATSELSTTFLPALILGALSSVEGTQSLRNKLATWLLTQKNDNWSFNYWAANAPERATRPYPDDLDDTCCVLIGLYLHDPAIIDSTCLAKVVRLLVAAEKEVGGPYKTWLVSKTAPAVWQDVDVAVNCNVAYFLRLVAEPLPKLDSFMEQVIITQQFQSPYYPASYIMKYYLARAYRGDQESQLADILLKEQKDGHWGTSGQTALALSALGHLGKSGPSSAMQYLLSQQLEDGSWPAEVVWLDEKQAKQTKYAGSPALTTALVLEALARSEKSESTISAEHLPDEYQPEFLQIISRAERIIAELNDPLRKHAKEMLGKLQQGPTGREMVLLPFMFADSLLYPPNVSKELYIQLGLANIFGWMAYTIYDDFLDEEGSAPLLSVANVSMRQSLACFAQAVPSDDFRQEVTAAFNRIDAANAWEVEYCRYQTDGQTIYVGPLPGYTHIEYLAERSLGHGLTPLAILLAAGIPMESPRTFYFKKAFRHYLAARQLHDDLHDWQQDFRKGHISYVAAQMLGELRISPGRHTCTALMLQLECQFWRCSLQTLCEKLRRQLRLSRQAYLASQICKDKSPFTQLLDILEDSTTRTLQEQQKAIEFLKAYRQK